MPIRHKDAPPSDELYAPISWETAAEYGDLLYEKGSGIAKISINRPDVHNAFRPQTLAELRDAFNRARDDIEVGSAKVKVRPVPHCGPTVGYRVDWHGVSIAYISDHQAPLDLTTVDEAVLELCEGVDFLIHDAQYTPEEFAQKAHWGHCTIDYAVLVAKEAGVRRLCLFHHDPAHGDDEMDRLLEGARRTAARLGVDEVTAAYEGMSLTF